MPLREITGTRTTVYSQWHRPAWMPPPLPVCQPERSVLSRCQCVHTIREGQPHAYLGAMLMSPACFRAAVGMGGR